MCCRDMAGENFARLHQAIEVDAGGEAHAFQHEHEVLGDDVAARSRSKGTAPEAGHRGIEPADAGFEARDGLKARLATPRGEVELEVVA